MSFWKSDLGQVSGNANDAFTKTFSTIPDGTMALAKIIEFKNDSFNGIQTFKIDWLLLEGEFKGQHVFQKIKAFEQDPKLRHKALNMLMLLFKMFEVTMTESQPTDVELKIFTDKVAGIKILETKPNADGKIYNFVGEVHPREGFTSVTGEKRIVASQTISTGHLDSALSRGNKAAAGFEGDIPW